MLPNENIKHLSPYVSIPHEVWNIKEQNDILKLDWNEASVQPSPKVYESIGDFLKKGCLNWYPNTHNVALLDKIAKYAEQDDYSYVQLFASSDAAHENIIDVFLNKTSRVCLISPTYDNFRARANGVGVDTIKFYLDDNFLLDFDQLDFFIIDKCIDFVYLCNPNNPTGLCYNAEKLENIILKHTHTMFLIDEAYYEFCGVSVAHLVKKCKNLIITRTFSKAFALASFRIGYIISHRENIEYIDKLRNSKSISMISQIAAMAALSDLDYTMKYVYEVNLAKKEFVNKLLNISLYVYKNSFANFVLIKSKDANAMVEYLKKNNIFIRNYCHLIPDHYRITIGTREQMNFLYDKMERFYAK
ncbi:histidinol-phosphate aminotransferase family protein [Campylobacter volucris]|uniref:Histidinol-phosphate aminotransferase family protein n=1 Tax=Campylobacter volucris TaxID=1031542 RepID=A0A5C7DWZ3_9BACT|nr:histidinol-phosphate transaminase [Campylobacter volucris]TXE89745.1 histidinol-phosphate aminotransferase family protein [Campylobacter volucris]